MSSLLSCGNIVPIRNAIALSGIACKRCTYKYGEVEKIHKLAELITTDAKCSALAQRRPIAGVPDEQAAMETTGHKARSIRADLWQESANVRTSSSNQTRQAPLLPGLFPVSPFHAALAHDSERRIRSAPSASTEDRPGEEGQATEADAGRSRSDHGEHSIVDAAEKTS